MRLVRSFLACALLRAACQHDLCSACWPQQEVAPTMLICGLQQHLRHPRLRPDQQRGHPALRGTTEQPPVLQRQAHWCRLSASPAMPLFLPLPQAWCSSCWQSMGSCGKVALCMVSSCRLWIPCDPGQCCPGQRRAAARGPHDPQCAAALADLECGLEGAHTNTGTNHALLGRQSCSMVVSQAGMHVGLLDGTCMHVSTRALGTC